MKQVDTQVPLRKNVGIWLFLLALLLRLAPVLAFSDLGIGLDDMFQYDMLARSIVAGEGYRWYGQDDLYLVENYITFDMTTVDYDPRGVLTSFRPPLYPAFLALIYFLSGVDSDRFFTARLVQAFLSAGMVPLTYALARRLFPDREAVAAISSWIITLYPMLIVYPLSLATENLFFILVLGSILLLLKAEQSRQWYWFGAAGIVLGLTALTRSVSLAFAGLAVLWAWFLLRERKNALMVFLTVTIVTLPWMVRNSILHGRPIGIESALGYDLYVGYHPDGEGAFEYPQSMDLIPFLDDGYRDELGQEKALEFIRDDPGRVPYLVLRRAGFFFGLERRAMTYFYSNNYFSYIPTGFFLVIAGLLLLPFVVVSTSAIVGFTVTSWNQKTLLVVLFFIGYITPHLLITAEDRFHLTIVPFLAMLSANYWVSGRKSLTALWTTSRGKIRLIIAGIIVLLLIMNWGLELWRDSEMLAQLLGPQGNMTYYPY